MTKTYVMHGLIRYSLLKNTFLFWQFIEVNLLICQKHFNNLANYPNGVMMFLYVFEKCMFMFIKYLTVTNVVCFNLFKVHFLYKGEMKDNKKVRCGIIVWGNYLNRNSPRWKMSRDHLSRRSIILGRSYPGAIIWGQFSKVGIVRGQLP